MSKAHSIEISFTRREVVHSSYTSRITPAEAEQLKNCKTRDEQLELMETLGADSAATHMDAGDISMDSVEALTELYSTDDYEIELLDEDEPAAPDITPAELGALLVAIGNQMRLDNVSFSTVLAGSHKAALASEMTYVMGLDRAESVVASLNKDFVLALIDTLR